MIVGFCAFPEGDIENMYDYSGCLYPEGVISSKQALLFNHEQIDKIYYTGLVDEEEKSFKEKLKELTGVMDSKNKPEEKKEASVETLE